MQAIQLVRHGSPETTCECIEVAEPTPQAGQIAVAIKAAAINPADLLIFEDRYPGPELLPAFVGIEGAGEVIAIGDGVTEYKIGDHVLSMGRANWTDVVCDDGNRFVPVPKELSWEDAAQLKANPPSAHLMLQDYVDLQPGDWVIQNAANSAVGRHVISFCKARGLRSINVVRRADLIDELTAHGGDIVVVQSDRLADEVREKTAADAPVRLAIDAIGGKATSDLADCLSNGGTVVNYGFISGEPCQLTSYHTVVHDITLKGFWLVGFMSKASRQSIVDMYARMSQAFVAGDISVSVEAEYPLARISEALAHANRESRSGKILLRPGG